MRSSVLRAAKRTGEAKVMLHVHISAQTAGQEWTVIKTIDKLKHKIKTKLGSGVFHDSRADVNALAEYCEVLTKKINELVDVVNELQSKQSKF